MTSNQVLAVDNIKYLTALAVNKWCISVDLANHVVQCKLRIEEIEWTTADRNKIISVGVIFN